MIIVRILTPLVAVLALTGCAGPGATPGTAAPATSTPAPRAAEPTLEPKPDLTLLRGPIQAVEPTGYRVRTGSGTTRIATDAQTGYALLADASLDSIRAGEYVGVAAAKQPDGTIRAIDVHIFPESMRGQSEGYFPWDLPGQGQTSMTNGTVTDKVAGVRGSALTLGAKGQTVTITVPAGTKIVRIQPSTAADVMRAGYGTLSVCVTGPDGTPTAKKVFAGVGGVQPPF